MSLLTPAFLLGLFGLGIPVWLHLSRRRTRNTVAFPSLMFLEQVPYRSMRRRRLRDVLLLLARCAALVLLTLAFARPLLTPAASATLGEGAEQLVLLVDRSFSMGYGDRWARAMDAAREAATTAAGDGVASLVVFDEQAAALTEPSSDSALLTGILDQLEPSDRSTRFAPALRLARRLVLDSELPRQRVVMITDLQRVGWNDDQARLPEGVELEIVDVSEGAEAANVAIAGVVLERQRDGSRERLVPSARLIQSGGEEREVIVELEINGREISSQVATLAGDGSAMIRFDPLTVESGIISRGVVRVLDDPLGADNEFRFTLSPAAALPVLIVDRARSSGGSSLYIRRALETAQQPPFSITLRTPQSLRTEDLSAAAVVLINDALHLLSDELQQRLVTFVESGGGAFIVLGPGHDRRAAIPSLGVSGEEIINQDRTGRSLALIDRGHEVFAPFAGARGGDFSAAHFFRYRRLENDGNLGVLARFDNGDVALAEQRLGEGRVLLWPSTLDTGWSDLVLQPIFLPWLDRSLRYLAGYSPPRESYQVGQVAEIEPPEGGVGEWLARTPGEERRSLQGDPGLLLELDRSGFWELRPVADDEQRLTLAVNVDIAESDLSRLDAEEMQLAWSGSRVTDGGPSRTTEVVNDPSRQKIWWGILLATLVLLSGESLLSNRRGGQRGQPKEA